MLKKSLSLLLLISLTSCSLSGVITDTSGKKLDQVNTENKTSEAKLKDLPVDKVQITSGDNLVINQGDKLDLSANVTYSDNSRDSALSWSSSDNTIAVMNSTTGALSGVKPGVVTVIATSLKDSSKRASTTVTVKKADVVEALTSISPKEASLKKGETVRLSAKIQLSDGTFSPNVIWKSDNSGVALVSNGLVTAVDVGTTTVTAIASGDSTKLASAKITVVADETPSNQAETEAK